MRRTPALLAAAALALPLAACSGEQQVRDVPEGEVTTSEARDAPATEVELPDESGSEDGVPDDNDLGTNDGEQ